MAPPSSTSSDDTNNDDDNNSNAANRKKARGPRIVQVLGRGGGWVDPATVPANHPQRTADRCLSCPPLLVLSDGKNTVTAFVTPPPKGSQILAQNTNTASNGRQLPSEQVSKICRRGTLIRIRDWGYTTMMLGGGRHYRHLTGTSSAAVGSASASSGGTSTAARPRPTMLCAVLPQNVPLTTPLALTVPWSSIEFIAGENGTVPIHHSHLLADVNASIEVRRILSDGGGMGPKNHLELSQRIRGWEEHFAAVSRLEMERTGNGSGSGGSAGRDAGHNAAAAPRGGVASLPPVRVSAAHTAAILAGRASSTRTASKAGGQGSNKNNDAKPNAKATAVKLGDPTKLLGTRNLSALLQTGMKGTDVNKQERQVEQEQEQEGSRRHQHNEQRGVRVGDASRLLSSAAGRAALHESVKAATGSTAGTTFVEPATTAKKASQGAAASDGKRAYASQNPVLTKAASSNLADDDDNAGPAPCDDEDENNHVDIEHASITASAQTTANTADEANAAKKKSVSLGDVRRLMASKQGRAALRSAISTLAVDDARKNNTEPAPVAAPVAAAAAAAAIPIQAEPQAPPPSQKRRRGGVSRRSSQKPEERAGTKNDGTSSQNAAKAKPSTPQETLAALQSLNTASLHSLFNQILSSGAKAEDDVERDRQDVPTPKKLSAMREEVAQRGEGSNGKDDEPLDLQFLLSDSEEAESSPEEGLGEDKKKAATQEDDETEGEEESEPIVGIGDMLVPPTQEQQQDSDLSQGEKAQGGSDEKLGGSDTDPSSKSNSQQDKAKSHTEIEGPSSEEPKQQGVQEAPTGESMELEHESDEEELSQETTQGSGENTAEGSPKKCAPARKAKESEEIDSDATVDENEVAAAPKVSSNQAVRPRALPPPPKSSRRLYTAYDSSSSSDSEDWDTSIPMPRETGGGNKKSARKRTRHLAVAPPNAKKPRPAPKKATAPIFSIEAMLARKKG